MKRSLFFVILLATLGLPAPDSNGSWGPSGCAAVAAPVQAAPIPADGWTESKLYPGWFAWASGGRWVGWYEPATGKYQAVLDGVGKRLGPVTSAPWEQSSGKTQDDLADWMIKGVDRSKLGDGRSERITINGREVSKADALDAIGKPGGPADIPDDAKRLRLTLAGGTDADRLKVLTELPPALRDTLVIQSYPAGHWALRPGFVSSGTPTIYLQSAPLAPGGAGKVLLRLDSYPGALALAEAVRKADPNYDPSRDPDGKPKPPPVPPAPPPGPDSGLDLNLLAMLAALMLGGGAIYASNRSDQK